MQIMLDQIDSPVRLVLDEPVSIEDFWRISAENGDLRMELEPNGELIVMTPTTPGTGYLGSRITTALANWAEEDGRGYSFDSSTGFVLPDGAVRSPDAAWVSGSRWRPDADDEKDTPLCPDFVIELRSKTDRLKAARKKMEMWIANGAQVAWLIDPLEKTVAIYRPGDEAEVLYHPTSVQGTGIVAGFELVMTRVWG